MNKVQLFTMDSNSSMRNCFVKMMVRLVELNEVLPKKEQVCLAEMFEAKDCFICTNGFFDGMGDFETVMFVINNCFDSLGYKPGDEFYAFEYKDSSVSIEPFWVLFLAHGQGVLAGCFDLIVARNEKALKEQVFKLLMTDRAQLLSNIK